MKTTDQREGIRELTSEEIKAAAGGVTSIDYEFHAGNGNVIPQANSPNTPAALHGLDGFTKERGAVAFLVTPSP